MYRVPSRLAREWPLLPVVGNFRCKRLTAAAVDTRTASLNDLLSPGRAAVQECWPISNNVVQYIGVGTRANSEGHVKLYFRPDGAFVEEVKTAQQETICGHDGGKDSRCWESDDHGIARYLDLDDEETEKLFYWVRLGLWLRPGAQEQLHLAVRTVTKAEAKDMSGKLSSTADQDFPSQNSNALRGQHGISIRFNNHRVDGMVMMDSQNGLPSSLKMEHPGDGLLNTFENWELLERQHWYPRVVKRIASGQVQCEYNLKQAKVLSFWDGMFTIPPNQLTPTDTCIEPKIGGHMAAWWTRSGHIVVEPEIDGQRVGYMILDTGASGSLVSTAVAEKLGMSKFGEYSLSGILEKSQSCSRRCKSLRLGPLEISNFIFMQLDIDDLVSGGPGETVGIIGHDVFRRCVMTVPRRSERKGQNTEIEIKVEDPSHYTPDASLESSWQAVQFVCNLPVIKGTVSVDSKDQDVRFLVDSGGVHLMFNARSTRRLKLLENIQTEKCTLRGVGGGKPQSAQQGILPKMAIKDIQYTDLKCSFVGEAGLDMSLYIDGLICNEMLGKCRTIIDFARQRLMFVPD